MISDMIADNNNLSIDDALPVTAIDIIKNKNERLYQDKTCTTARYESADHIC